MNNLTIVGRLATDVRLECIGTRVEYLASGRTNGDSTPTDADSGEEAF